MADELTKAPFTAFNFSVELDIPGVSSLACGASFAECDGLEMTMEVKTIREGGNNGRQIRLTGPIAYGTLTLKRGLTDSFHLWDWFTAMQERPALRASAGVVILTEDGKQPRAHFKLSRCLPVKLKAPPLNAKDGMVAIEELQVAYETMQFVPPS